MMTFLKLQLFLLIIISTSCDMSSRNKSTGPHFYQLIEKSSFELAASPSWDRKEYNILTNTTNIDEARIVFFGDVHDSVDVVQDFFSFGSEFLRADDVVFFEADSETIKTLFFDYYKNTYNYVLGTFLARQLTFKKMSGDKFIDFDSVAKYLELSFRERIRTEFAARAGELTLSPSVFSTVIADGWDTQKFISDDEKTTMKLVKSRNEYAIKKLDEYSHKKLRLFFGGSFHVPHYQAAISKVDLLPYVDDNDIAKQMIKEKSLSQFYALCRELPENLREISNCNSAEEIWNYLLNSGLPFALLAKKKTSTTFRQEGGFRHEKIIRENDLVPSKI